MTITEIREKTGLNMTDFAKAYGIPFRTLQNWERGTRTPPPYVLELLKKAIEKER